MNEREALKLALEALEYPLNQSYENFNVDMAELLSHRAVTAIKEVLAQPEQKPVAWLTDRDAMYFDKEDARRDCDGFIFPLFTLPQRTWVWLSSEEEKQIKDNCTTVACVLKAVKAKLKEKNT